ncbi:hypothetical protein BDV10DRAFT_46817 [Aspergillus recurvatus]
MDIPHVQIHGPWYTQELPQFTSRDRGWSKECRNHEMGAITLTVTVFSSCKLRGRANTRRAHGGRPPALSRSVSSQVNDRSSNHHVRVTRYASSIVARAPCFLDSEPGETDPVPSSFGSALPPGLLPGKLTKSGYELRSPAPCLEHVSAW